MVLSLSTHEGEEARCAAADADASPARSAATFAPRRSPSEDSTPPYGPSEGHQGDDSTSP